MKHRKGIIKFKIKIIKGMKKAKWSNRKEK